MTKLLHKQLTGTIIKVYYDVYNGTSRTYPEHIYENAVTGDLRSLRIPCHRQDEYQVFYKFGHLQVNNSVFVFPVAVQDINDIRISNLKDWMRVQSIPISILANFHDTSLDPIVLRM